MESAEFITRMLNEMGYFVAVDGSGDSQRYRNGETHDNIGFIIHKDLTNKGIRLITHIRVDGTKLTCGQSPSSYQWGVESGVAALGLRVKYCMASGVRYVIDLCNPCSIEKLTSWLQSEEERLSKQ